MTSENARGRRQRQLTRRLRPRPRRDHEPGLGRRRARAPAGAATATSPLLSGRLRRRHQASSPPRRHSSSADDDCDRRHLRARPGERRNDLVWSPAATCARRCGNSGAVRLPAAAPRRLAGLLRDRRGLAAATTTERRTSTRGSARRPDDLVSAGAAANVTASFAAASADGANVFFTTTESLSAPTPTTPTTSTSGPVGRRARHLRRPCTQASGGARASTRSARRRSSVLFSTAEQLDRRTPTPAPTSTRRRSAAARPRWSPRGEAPCPPAATATSTPRFEGLRRRRARLLHHRRGLLGRRTTTPTTDIYARDVGGGDDEPVTTAPGYCPLNRGACGAIFAGASSDGSHVFFTTVERFTAKTATDEADVYERSSATTRRRSPAWSRPATRAPRLGPAAAGARRHRPRFAGQSTDARGPRARRNRAPTIKLYTTSDCSGEPVATGTAAELGSPGIARHGRAPARRPLPGHAPKPKASPRPARPRLLHQAHRAPRSAASDRRREGGGGGQAPAGQPRVRAPGRPRHRQGGGRRRRSTSPRTRGSPSARPRRRERAARSSASPTRPARRGPRSAARSTASRWRRCGSPLKLKRLKPGQHVFQVKAVNAVGTAGAAPGQAQVQGGGAMRARLRASRRSRGGGGHDPGRAAGRLGDGRRPRRRRRLDADQRRARPAAAEQEGADDLHRALRAGADDARDPQRGRGRPASHRVGGLLHRLRAAHDLRRQRHAGRRARRRSNAR